MTPLAAFTGLAKQSYWAAEDIYRYRSGYRRRGKQNGRWQKKKEKREKESEQGKDGEISAKAGPDHGIVTMVRLGAHYVPEA